MIYSIISAHPVIFITMHVPQTVRQWCRIFIEPDRFLWLSSGKLEMLLDFFTQRPVRRLSVCMHVCMHALMGARLTDNETMVLVGYSCVTENEHSLFSDTWMCSLLGFAASGWRVHPTILRSANRRTLEEIQCLCRDVIVDILLLTILLETHQHST